MQGSAPVVASLIHRHTTHLDQRPQLREVPTGRRIHKLRSGIAALQIPSSLPLRRSVQMQRVQRLAAA